MCSVSATAMDHDMCMEGVACVLVLRIAGVPAPQGLDRWWTASIKDLDAAHHVLCGRSECPLIRFVQGATLFEEHAGRRTSLPWSLLPAHMATLRSLAQGVSRLSNDDGSVAAALVTLRRRMDAGTPFLQLGVTSSCLR